jgi:hypothetical protein
MSNVKLSLTAISTALGLAIAVQSGSAMAQTASQTAFQAISADALKGTQFDSSDYIRRSWGLEQVSYDAPSIKLNWPEIHAQLQRLNAPETVARIDARPVAADALKGTQFDSPDYVRHSWGLEQVSFDAPSIKLNWSEVNARLAQAATQSKSAPHARLQPISAEILRGTQFDAPDYVRHSWGLEYVPYDAPTVRLNWAEVSRRLGEVNAGSASESTAG